MGLHHPSAASASSSEAAGRDAAFDVIDAESNGVVEID